MQSSEIRQKFLKFFEEKWHKIVPSSSLVPEGDSSTLFVSAGVQPLAPYILGEPHPAGKRIVNIQKCVRVQDIEEVGDKTHDTFFEMMGNWSFNDYFKEDAIKWSYELLTDKEKGFGLDPKRLYITVFGGNDDAPKDSESFEIWKKYMLESRIYFMTWNGKKEPNWWDAGDNGPAGPDTEMFYDITPEGLGDLNKEEYIKADEEQKVVEIWNDVFMEYLKKDGKVVGKLETRNVDTGSGLERLAMAIQGKDSIFDTDLFETLMPVAKKLSDNIKSQRIIADHFRTSVFMIADGVTPSNTDQGYVLRRLLRRALVKTKNRSLDSGDITLLVNGVSDKYGYLYKNITEKIGIIKQVIEEEIERFKKTLDLGLKKFYENIESPFVLWTTYGLPIEITRELAKESNLQIRENDFEEAFRKHQELSRAGSEQKFKGGLAGHSEMEVKYHTTTHLLHQALHDVLGDEVEQRGSNITPERLRFDFSFPRKLTGGEKERVEELVNQKISEGLAVNKVVMPKAEAEKTGARRFFGEKYPEEVSVYYIGDSLDKAYSKEFCGGPHVENISTLGKFKITKEEAVSAGVRRIKATLD